MSKCNNCNGNFALLEIKKGLCKQCTKQLNEKNIEVVEEQKKQVEAINSKIKDIPFITSESFLPRKTVKTLGTARGATVRAKHIGRDFMADIKNIVGGEIKGYTELLAEGREEAIYRMKEDAEKLGANAIVSVRFTTSTINTGAAEMLAYGTAVQIEAE